MKSVPTGVESSGVSWVIQVGVGMRWNSWVLIGGLGRAALASTRHRAIGTVGNAHLLAARCSPGCQSLRRWTCPAWPSS
jgi:hypothetical protein